MLISTSRPLVLGTGGRVMTRVRFLREPDDGQGRCRLRLVRAHGELGPRLSDDLLTRLYRSLACPTAWAWRSDGGRVLRTGTFYISADPLCPLLGLCQGTSRGEALAPLGLAPLLIKSLLLGCRWDTWRQGTCLEVVCCTAHGLCPQPPLLGQP